MEFTLCNRFWSLITVVLVIAFFVLFVVIPVTILLISHLILTTSILLLFSRTIFFVIIIVTIFVWSSLFFYDVYPLQVLFSQGRLQPLLELAVLVALVQPT